MNAARSADTGATVLAPPDREGVLAAAALRRVLDPPPVVKLLLAKDVSRRLAALADEPDDGEVYVVDLVPTDSIETLVEPALARLRERARPVRWIYAAPEAPDPLRALGDVIHLTHGAESTWRLALRDRHDDDFASFASEIEAGSSTPGRAWSDVLDALETSWDWPRMYRAIALLEQLGSPDDADPEWAAKQMTEVRRLIDALDGAPRRDALGRAVVVLVDVAISSTVRPEALRTARDDVDALFFASSPGRLVALARAPDGDLSWLAPLHASSDIPSSAVRGPRIDVTWRPGGVPSELRDILGDDACARIEELPPGAEHRIVRDRGRRIAKGLDLDRLEPEDLEAIERGIAST